jgi:hypothetical protein
MNPFKTRISVFAILLFVAAIAWSLAQRNEAEPQPADSTQSSQAQGESVPAPSAQQAGTQAQAQTSMPQEEDFEKVAARALDAIPTKDKLRSLSAEEVHHTPAVMIEAASELGEVAEALEANMKQAENNPSELAKVISAGIAFYSDCASGEERPESIRALCYSHYRELREKAGDAETAEEAANVPEQVKVLANFLVDG